MFYTPVEIPDYPFRLTYRDASLWTGSCFTENIGSMLYALRFHCEINPFGPLYNPVSILSGLEMLLNREHIAPDTLFESNELWLSFMFHSLIADTDREQAARKMNDAIDRGASTLHRADALFGTFGTAYTFVLKSTGKTVSNCHKLPSSMFEHKLLSSDAIVKAYSAFVAKLLNLKPALRIVFSVSPIRHTGNGAHANQISKATLLLAVDELLRRFPESCFYFPAYEIVMDELRDYRFYAQDLRHLSDTAVEHIRQKFTAALIDAKEYGLMKEIEHLNRAREHRPLHSNTKTYINFVKTLAAKEADLQAKNPHLRW
jgi:hypothetical protein